MPAKFEFHFTVSRGESSIPFPIDMLRYDHAVPASESDAGQIERTFQRGTRGPVEIKLRGPIEPTAGRWRSFGWSVKSSEKRRVA